MLVPNNDITFSFTGKDPRKGTRTPQNHIKCSEQRDGETGYGYFGASYIDHELTTMWLSVDPMMDSNRQKSKVRSRVEHVFGFMEQTMGGLFFRGVGMMRAKANIALTNLVYNMCRLVQIEKYQPNLIAIQ